MNDPVIYIKCFNNGATKTEQFNVNPMVLVELSQISLDQSYRKVREELNGVLTKYNLHDFSQSLCFGADKLILALNDVDFEEELDSVSETSSIVLSYDDVVWVANYNVKSLRIHANEAFADLHLLWG